MEHNIFLLEEYLLKVSPIFKKVGEKAAITDYAMLLGGKCSKDKFVGENLDLKNRVGLWRLHSYSGYGKCRYERNFFHPKLNFSNRRGGYRPVTSATFIKDKGYNEHFNQQGVKEIEYGEYPQYVVESNFAKNLEQLFQNGQIISTGKNYTKDANSIYSPYDGFEPLSIPEYEFNGEKYIRIHEFEPGSDTLSNGEKINLKKAYWVKVEPITWLIDETNDFAITKNIMFSGISYAEPNHYFDYGIAFYGQDDFFKTIIGEYLNTCFINEIMPYKEINHQLKK